MLKGSLLLSRKPLAGIKKLQSEGKICNFRAKSTEDGGKNPELYKWDHGALCMQRLQNIWLDSGEREGIQDGKKD